MGKTDRRSESQPHSVELELASIQRYIALLKADLDAAGFSPNKVVIEGIAKSQSVLDKAIDFLAETKSGKAWRYSKVAWIHALFARVILDAEMTEQYLGDQNFLELKDSDDDWEAFVETELGCLEEEIIKLREEIRGGAL